MRRRKWPWIRVGASIFLHLAIRLTCLRLIANSLLTPVLLTGGIPEIGVPEDSVAVVRVEGVLVSGREHSESTIERLRRAEDEPAVKAIVLRVDSPGGGVVASDETYGALSEIEKPIVVSIGDVAASAGYYISYAAIMIVAIPTTLTSSWG
jgi:protease-4